MRLPIQTARHAHAVRTPAQLEQRQREAIAKQAESAGDAVAHPHPGGRLLVARVNHGRWLGDCDCGAGVAIEPAWANARCFGCGAVYSVQMPAERVAIEDVLSARPRRNQNWTPGESVTDLIAENVAHGVAV